MSSEEDQVYPRPLVEFCGPMPGDRVERVIEGMGKEGVAARSLVERGLAPPELATGLTLALLSVQPRQPSADGAPRASAVSGGVWVREQLTVHAPVPIDAPLVISGAALARFARKGRRYAVSSSETRDARGRLLAENRTTGLELYRADPDLADFYEGVPESELPAPGPDSASAAANPCVDRIRTARGGDVLTGAPVEMSLRRLQDRDGPVPANPIHSDPEAARRAGLDVPIAGGAHVLAFVQEVLLQAWGDEALYHGAHLDVRWKAPVRAGMTMEPRAEVIAVSSEAIELALEARCGDLTAMTARVVIPLPVSVR